jgi:hypothetical protein
VSSQQFTSVVLWRVNCVLALLVNRFTGKIVGIPFNPMA